jgi:hypothetical protein
MSRITLLLALVFMAAPAVAQAPATQTRPSPKAQKPADKLVCRFINTTGSRLIGDRVCKTRAQWDADADAAREDFENAPRRPSGDPTPASAPN